MREKAKRSMIRRVSWAYEHETNSLSLE